jgi:hypothetical protein
MPGAFDADQHLPAADIGRTGRQRHVERRTIQFMVGTLWPFASVKIACGERRRSERNRSERRRSQELRQSHPILPDD